MTVSTRKLDIAGRRTADGPSTDAPTDLEIGTVVEVRSRFDQRWTRGFAVAAATGDTYQVRRVSDGSVLPAWFPRDEIRLSAS